MGAALAAKIAGLRGAGKALAGFFGRLDAHIYPFSIPGVWARVQAVWR